MHPSVALLRADSCQWQDVPGRFEAGVRPRCKCCVHSSVGSRGMDEAHTLLPIQQVGQCSA